MKRILFVDDEPKVLEGLQRLLRGERTHWEMEFAASGAEALALLEAGTFDVIVTDMRMPEMDGASLLAVVRDRFPGVVRMVLSGYFEMEAAMRAVPVAHQYLAKPCDPAKLRDAVERACGYAAILTDEAARRIVGAVGRLPSLPRTCATLFRALQDPDVPIEEIGRIIEQDVGMTAKVLQLVNSAFFGLLQHITTVRTAVSHLGLDVLKQLVLSAEVFRTFQPGQHIPGFSIEAFQEHSRLAAGIAGRLPLPKKMVSSAVVAALLHDAGKLVLAVRLPQQFERTIRQSREENRPLCQVERELTGVSHAEIGAYLLALWGLPLVVVDAVCRHHRPRLMEDSPRDWNVLAATHVSDALAHELQPMPPGSPTAAILDIDYLAALGVAEQLESCREVARAVPHQARG